MNRGQIRTLCRKLLNEDTAGFWTDDDLNTFINIGYQKIIGEISTFNEDFFTKSVTFSTVSGDKSYTLPTDFGSMRRLEHYDASDASDIQKLDEMDFPAIEHGGEYPFVASGTPTRFTIIANRMDLLPIPDAAYTMRMYYNASAADMTSDADIPLAPPDFHDMIAFWACVLALTKNQESPAEYVGLYNIRKEDMISNLTGRKSDDPHMVVGYLEGSGMSRW